MQKIVLALPLLALALVGCGGTGCNVEVASNMIQIDSVTLNGVKLQNVLISNLKINGNEPDRSYAGGAKNLNSVTDGYNCVTVCSFGMPGNHYTFDVSALGSKTKSIDLTINSRELHGGCGLSGITGDKKHLNIVLDPK